MSQVITATFEDGLLKPDERLELSPGTKVRLIVELLEDSDRAQALEEFDRLCDEITIDSGAHLTRDQLHERRSYDFV